MKNSPFKIYWITSAIIFFGISTFLFWLKIIVEDSFLKSWSWWLLYFLAINVTTGFLYFWDKVNAIGRENTLGYKVNAGGRRNTSGHKNIASRKRVPRVPELVLHILALLGGSPTALLSQKIFHHKTSKQSFLLIYWLIVLIQIGLIVWYFKNQFFREI